MQENKIKAQFFAMYLGQAIFARTKTDEQYPIIVLPQHLNDERGYLLLRDISQLEKAECLNIAEIFDLSKEAIEDTDLIEWIEALFSEPAGYCLDGYAGNQLLSAIDYLRSIGVLLPFKGMTETQIISKGWAKIKED